MGGKTSYASIKKYEDKTYDKLLLRVHKGEREKIKAAADARGLSVNQFIIKAIAAEMEKGPDAETSGQ